MVDEKGGDNRLKIELLTKTLELCDKIDESFQEINKKTNTNLKLILEECERLMSYIDNEKANLIIIHNQIKSKPANSWNDVASTITRHESKVVKLLLQVKKLISKKTCHQCQNQLSNQPYIYHQKQLRQWTINQPFEFDNFFVVFCSPLCFKNSIYSPQPKTKTEPNSRPTHHNQNSEEDHNYCSECNQQLPSKYYYHKTKNDQEKFCSKNCFTNFYGETCLECWNKFLEIYPLSESQPEFTYCWDCLQKVQAEEAKRKAEQAARFNFDGKKQVQKILEAMKKGLKEKIEKENQEQAEKEVREKQQKEQKSNLNSDSEQNRTEQNRTEQNRTEQMRSDTNRHDDNSTDTTANQQNTNNTKQTNNNNNPQNPNNLKSQINSLASEIKVLESNQTNKNLLNAKKAELEELQNKLNQQNNQNNSKLYLGIGLGVLGGGIIGVILFLIFRKKDK